MKMYLIERKGEEPEYDVANGFVIAAPTPMTARLAASRQHGDEGKHVWLDPKLSRCRCIAQDSVYKKVTIVLVDFRAG